MDLQLRKYKFIQELVHVENESIIDALERVLKRAKEQHEDISTAHKKELDHRLESYTNNPDDVLDWETLKNDW
jgi:predicted secreted Zn-dependent protease